MNKKVKVSICCIAYNQEDYIREAIESFLNQKTNFEYEIVIHDDASTDNTKKIIEEYAKKYSNIVPIFEKENVYTKNPNSIIEILFKKAKGEYIALCDGDDGFADSKKLQLQVEYMDKHKEVSLCTHNTRLIDESGDYLGDMIPYKKKIIKMEDFFAHYSSMHTSSMLFRKKDVIKLPSYFYRATVGDLPLKLHLLTVGNCYHMNKVMSYYRTNAKGSWTMLQKGNNQRLRANHEMEIDVYRLFNENTNYKYNDLIEKRILNKSFDYYKGINNLEELQKEEYKELYDKLSVKEKFKMRIKRVPGIHKLYTKIRYRK